MKSLTAVMYYNNAFLRRLYWLIVYLRDPPHFVSTFFPAWTVHRLLICLPAHPWYPGIEK